MPTPHEKILSRFSELLKQGWSLRENWYHGYPDSTEFHAWKTSIGVLLGAFRRADMDDWCAKFSAARQTIDAIEEGQGRLIGYFRDYEAGMFDISAQIESEISIDFMEQAERVLDEGRPNSLGHIAAAMLSGAVLERALRHICEIQVPPLSTTLTRSDGKVVRLTLMPLIDSLKRANVIKEARAKQLRAWADLRNHADHGEFELCPKPQVELMVRGIDDFLAQH